MKTYDFTLILNRAPSDDEVNALYEAGFDSDGIVIGGPGQESYIMTLREAENHDVAVALATKQAESCGLKITETRSLDSKPRAGRPSLSKPGKRSPQLTVVIPTTIEVAIERDAKRLGIKKTQVARDILVDYYSPKARRKAKTAA